MALEKYEQVKDVLSDIGGCDNFSQWNVFVREPIFDSYFEKTETENGQLGLA